MSILRFLPVILFGLGLAAAAGQEPTVAGLALAHAYGLPPPLVTGNVTGPLDIGQPNVLVYIDEPRRRVTMLYTDSHSALLSEIGADGATVTPRFAFNPFGYYVVQAGKLSAPLHQPPPGLDEDWPMVVPIYQRVSEVATQISLAGDGRDAARLNELLDQIIVNGNETRSRISREGFAECIRHEKNGVFQGCW